MVDVEAAELHLQLAAREGAQLEVGLAEDHVEVARADALEELLVGGVTPRPPDAAESASDLSGRPTVGMRRLLPLQEITKLFGRESGVAHDPPSVKALTGSCLGIVRMRVPFDMTMCLP